MTISEYAERKFKIGKDFWPVIYLNNGNVILIDGLYKSMSPLVFVLSPSKSMVTSDGMDQIIKLNKGINVDKTFRSQDYMNESFNIEGNIFTDNITGMRHYIIT